jgi:plasmid replication initiation protein
MNLKNTQVYQSNVLIESSYRLTLAEQRLVLACIGQVKSDDTLKSDDEFEVTAAQLAALSGCAMQQAYRELNEAAENLFQRYVILDSYPNTGQKRVRKLKTRWLSSIEYKEGEGTLVLTFAQKIIPYLSQLRAQFTKYKLEHVGKMRSVHGIRLYELLMQWQNTGQREVEIAWLKTQLQLEDSYPAIKDFKKYVIDHAVNDINTYSNLTVSYTQRKKGRVVTHLIFSFTDKYAPKPEEKQAKKREKRILGVPVSEIEKQARPGESYEAAAMRVAKERGTGNGSRKKTP